jgi:hypothetical protein
MAHALAPLDAPIAPTADNSDESIALMMVDSDESDEASMAPTLSPVMAHALFPVDAKIALTADAILPEAELTFEGKMPINKGEMEIQLTHSDPLPFPL